MVPHVASGAHTFTIQTPDGIALGNYRTTAKGVNLEVQWSAPHDSEVPKIVALRSTLERFMGTPTAPAGSLRSNAVVSLERSAKPIRSQPWLAAGI